MADRRVEWSSAMFTAIGGEELYAAKNLNVESQEVIRWIFRGKVD